MATSTPANYGNYPLKDIPEPHAHDVLCGRGGGTNNHIGNSHWRMLVAANKQLYITLPKRQKMLLSRSIVNAIRSQQPPGRFLQKDSKSGKWYDVGDQRAQEKTSQALREGAPDLKKKVAAKVPSDDKESASSQAADHPEADNGDSEDLSTSSVDHGPAEQRIPENVPSEIESSVPIPANGGNPQSPKPAHSDLRTAMNNNHHTPCNPHFGNMSQMHGVYPMGMYPGGMPAHFFSSMSGHGYPQYPPPQGMMLYAGPHMQPVQVFPTMVMNEHGMLVPGMSMMPAQHHNMGNHNQTMTGSISTPATSNQNQQQQQQAYPSSAGYHPSMASMPHPLMTPQVSAADSEITQSVKNTEETAPSSHATTPLTTNREQHHQHDNPHPHQNLTPTFDDFVEVSPPEGGLEGNILSFGSVMMSEADMVKLQANGTFGSTMSIGTSHRHDFNDRYDDAMPPTVQQGLEAANFSIGDSSMMSVGTKLEATGTSFGTAMSFTPMPDGGLEAVGASLGELSLDDPKQREHLFQALELSGGGPEIPPMFPSEDKATGNLLECSDTESEEEDQNPHLVAQQSEAWEKMQHHVAQTKLRQSQSKGSSTSSCELMPPPKINPSHVTVNGSGVDPFLVPTTSLQRDFSELSAFDHNEGVPQDRADDSDDDEDDENFIPPPALEKQGSEDGEKALVGYLSRQT